MPGQALVTIDENQWNVWVASTYAELTTGLSGRASIPSGTGMLFVLGTKRQVTVDTSQMLFPIDIIFISEGLVIDVASDIQPGYLVTEETLCAAFLEVNAGEATGVEVGDTVSTATIQQPGFDWSSIMSFATPLAALGFVCAMAGGVMKLAGGSSSSPRHLSHAGQSDIQGKGTIKERLVKLGVNFVNQVIEDIQMGRNPWLYTCEGSAGRVFAGDSGVHVPAANIVELVKRDPDMVYKNALWDMVMLSLEEFPEEPWARGLATTDVMRSELKVRKLGVESLTKEEEEAYYYAPSLQLRVDMLIGMFPKETHLAVEKISLIYPPPYTLKVYEFVSPDTFREIYRTTFSLVDVERLIGGSSSSPKQLSRGSAGSQWEKETRFIGGCKVVNGLCHTHGYSVSKTVRCPKSPFTDEEWGAAWELAEQAYPEGMSNPWVNGWWPETLEEAEGAAKVYEGKMGDAIRMFREKQRAAIANYERVADKATYNYRRYVVGEYEKGRELSFVASPSGHHAMWLTPEQRKDLEGKYGAVAVRWAEEATRPGDIKAAERAAEYYYKKIKEAFGLGHLSPELSEEQIMKLRETLGLPKEVPPREKGYIE